MTTTIAMITMSQITAGTLPRSRDEDHVLVAVVRVAVEPAIHAVDDESRLVEQAEPLGDGEPVEAEGRHGSVRADGERERPRALVPVGPLEDARLALEPAAVRLLDVLAARGEDVEDEAAVGLEEVARRTEGAQLLLLGLHVQERTERADDERHTLVDGRLAEVAEAE